jgi:cytochrome c oxidase subunit 2
MLALGCGGCSPIQTALAPAGAGASQVLWLIEIIVAVCAAIWLAVMAVLAASLLRRRQARDGAPPDLSLQPSRELRLTVVVTAAVAVTVVVITAFTVLSFAATRRLSADATDPLVIDVKAYQWWWQVTYHDPQSGDELVTANEIHLPVGREATIRLAAADVIHSFWVPSLAGKQDLIPGRDNTIELTAERPGLYRGQCAEFCGFQHAHMAMLVVAQSPRDFEAWRAAQHAPAKPPVDAEQAHGRELFEGKACAACHTVRGTPAAGTLGPDLTHVASRKFIAAGLVETTRGSLAAWIADPQTLKPGNNMPQIPLDADELRAVSAYLAGLQ